MIANLDAGIGVAVMGDGNGQHPIARPSLQSIFGLTLLNQKIGLGLSFEMEFMNPKN